MKHRERKKKHEKSMGWWRKRVIIIKKAWDDIKSFITVTVMLLFAYCIIMQIPIDDTLKSVLATVVGFFLGTQAVKNNKD